MSKPISVTLYQPHKNQRIIHDSINNELFKYYILDIGRQFGKTLLADNQALYWALNDKGCKIGWVSPIYKQVKKVYLEIEQSLVDSGLWAEHNRTDLFLKTVHGSTIQFFSAERYDNIRGNTFDYLICDEFAFIDESAWTEVLRATVLVKGKKVLLISTPKGKNHFYRLFQLDGQNPQYKSFKMTSYDNPIINPTEIDDARLTLPDHVFRQEYLAEFIEGGTELFSNITHDDNPSKDGKLFAGIDLGRADDYTVLTILNSKGQMIFCDRWRHDSWTSIVSKLLAKLNEFKPTTYVEINSIGDAIFEQLKAGYRDIAPFVTTSKSKNDIIEGLIVANQSKEFSIKPIDWLIKEFDVFTYEYSPQTRSVKYSAPYGFHDDGVMSCAIAYHALKNLKTRGSYSFV